MSNNDYSLKHKGFTKGKRGKSTSCKNCTQIISNMQNPHLNLGRLRRLLDQLLSKSEVDRSHVEISGTRIDLNLRSGAGTPGGRSGSSTYRR